MTRNGERTFKADNDVYPGIMKVYRLLREGRIKINKDNCDGLLKELGMYSWDDKKAVNGGKEEPLKQNDHYCDALRYLAMAVVRDFESFTSKYGEI